MKNINQQEDIFFICEKNNFKKSVPPHDLNKLSKSNQEVSDEKYICDICKENIKDIKNGNAIICYQFQTKSHKKCFDEWENKCNTENTNFICPKCKYELPSVAKTRKHKN